MSKQQVSPMLLPKPKTPKHRNTEHILSLIGDPSSDERRALREIVRDADLIQVDDVRGVVFLLAPLSPAIVDILAAFEAEHEDLDCSDFDEGEHLDEREEDDPLEDGDEDCCNAYEDDLGRSVSDGKPGDPEDSWPEGGMTGFNPWKMGRMPDGRTGWVFTGYEPSPEKK